MKEKPGTFTVRLDPALRDKLQKIADKDKRKLGNLIQKILEDYAKGAK
jgi:predicted transcriptional regulator